MEQEAGGDWICIPVEGISATAKVLLYHCRAQFQAMQLGSGNWGSGQVSRRQSCVIHHYDSTSQAAVSQHSFLCSTILFFGSSAYSLAVLLSIARLGSSGLFLCCHNTHIAEGWAAA